MADFNIDVVEGEDEYALYRLVDETIAFLHELASLIESRPHLARAMFEGLPYELCVRSMHEFGPYGEMAMVAARDVSREQMRYHALEGLHLRNKIKMVAYYHGQFDTLMQSAGAEQVQQVPEMGFIGRRLLRRVLKSLETILESLLGELPGGGALLEMKQMFDNALRD